MRFADYNSVAQAGETEMTVLFKAQHRIIKDRLRAIKTIQVASKPVRVLFAPAVLFRIFGAMCSAAASVAHVVDSASASERRAADIVGRVETIHFDPDADYNSAESYYIITEWIPGGSLSERLATGALPREEVESIAVDLLSALELVHGHGLTHGNLKPSNILFTSEGAPRIVDFGGNALGPGVPIRSGSAPYLSPEQWAASASEPIDPDPRCDLFSLSLLLYEMLTGRQAPRCLSPNDLPSQVTPGVPAVWDEIILRGIHSDLTSRFQSAPEMCAHIVKAASGGPTLAVQAAPREARTDGFQQPTDAAYDLPPVEVSEPPLAEQMAEPPKKDTKRAGERRINDTDGAEMVWVPAGTLSMGSENSKEEMPVHPVEVAGFWCYRYPVTQAQYMKYVRYMRELVGRDGAQVPGLFMRGDEHVTKAAAGVQWKEAAQYAEWAGCRLPTEPEWEWAARGPKNSLYPWGDTWDQSCANTQETGVYEQTDVSRFAAGTSWCDAVDLLGNVFEWCSSLYLPYPYNPDDGREAPETPGDRVLRGGAATISSAEIRSTARFKPSSRTTMCGLRLVKIG